MNRVRPFLNATFFAVLAFIVAIPALIFSYFAFTRPPVDRVIVERESQTVQVQVTPEATATATPSASVTPLRKGVVATPRAASPSAN